MAGRASAGWVPNQHGAWAMLAVPIAAGLTLRPTGSAYAPFLAACCVLGYFAFHASSQWLKSAPVRRGRYRPAMLAYTALALGVGVIALALGGWPLLHWLPPVVALLAPALWLAQHRNERALLGGALTTAAACLTTVILAYRSPAAVVADWPEARTALLLAATLFGYFFGTVLHVKSLIRERGNPRIEHASTVWHLGWTAASVPLWGWFPGLIWTAIFAATTIRTVALVRFARSGPVRPLTIGLIEVALSALVLAGVLVTAGS
ncbi:YwiC-like family protein [Micropruina sp.]|uniref:YwiC-like family protein n=1 Tax=Micropruina sp. TaxID=2737536 RepID=UPI00262E9A4B|nr:YwiC-like family protein [Micropruina sp.]